MSTMALPLRDRTRSRHEALLWHGTEQLLGRTVPFVTDALATNASVMVATREQTWQPLRRALGDDAARIRYVDMTLLGANPARIIPAWLDFVRANGDRPSRVISEALWAGRRAPEVAECHIHEAALNLVVPASTPLWLLCLYDADALDEDALREAHRTHPLVTTHATSARSDAYDPEAGRTLAAQRLPEPPGRPHRLRFRRGGLGAVRQFVTLHSAAAGLGTARTEDLALAISELAANSLDHAGGCGLLRAWQDRDALVFEVSDAGQIADPLVGRINPGADQSRGRGLWIVNQLCDLVQVRSGPKGTAVRAVTWLPPAP